MEVVGFTYDADVHCVKCTRKWLKAQYNDEFNNAEGVIEGFLDFKDSEGNSIRPVFDTDEAGDSPDHCGDCRAYIDTSWHGDTVHYAVNALWEYVNAAVAQTFGGDPDVLDIWSEQLGNCVTDGTDDLVKSIYDFVRNGESDLTNA